MANLNIIVERVACPIDWTSADRTARRHACAHCANHVIDLQNHTPESLARLAGTHGQTLCALLPEQPRTVLPLSYAPPGRPNRWRLIAVVTALAAATSAWAYRHFTTPSPTSIRFMSPVHGFPTTMPVTITVNGRSMVIQPTTQPSP